MAFGGRQRVHHGVRWALSLALGAAAVAVIAMAGAIVQTRPAEAHCDSVNGPVVGVAREALARSDVRLVLPYVQPEAEAELTAAFNHALAARKPGGAAAEVADRWFFETAVRLHRTGEGAAYTGLKDAVDLSPALAAAEHALEDGDVDGVVSVLSAAVHDGVATRFQAVQAARAEAVHAGTVDADRVRVEAELTFEKYVEQIFQAAIGTTPHVEGGPAPAGGHEHTQVPSPVGN